MSLISKIEGVLKHVRDAEAIRPSEATAALALLDEVAAALQLPAVSASNGAPLLALPPDVLVQVLVQLPPSTLATAARVCRSFGGGPRRRRAAQPLVEQALRLQPQPARVGETALACPPPPLFGAEPDARELLYAAVRGVCSGAARVLGAGRSHSVFVEASTGRLLTCACTRSRHASRACMLV